MKFGAKVSARAEVDFTRHLRLGKGVQIGSFCKIKASDGPLEIGDSVHIGVGTVISAFQGGITLGADTLVSPHCTIISNMYRHDRLDVPLREQGRDSKGVRIGRNCFLGAGTVVVDGTTIGDNVIVSPNSVVSGTIPANTILQGNPARVVLTRQ